MKKVSVSIRAYLWVILFCFSVFAQDFKSVRDGIEYAELTKEVDKTPVKMNLLRLDLTKVRLDVVHALDAAIGLEKTSSIAARHGAFAAINGGFFRIDKSIFEGDDVSVLMIDGKLLSEGFGRTALLIRNYETKTDTIIRKLSVSLELTPGKADLKISGINRERKKDEAILYSPLFHRTTLTDNDGLEMVLVDSKIVKIFDGKGSTVIPENGGVLSANGKPREELKKLKVGDEVVISYNPVKRSDSYFSSYRPEDIVSGVPQLIKNGKIDITWQEEKSSKEFAETKHPRTAVAKLNDGKFLMVTVDGRSESSGGIGLQNLAEILLELGATDAMNLDGGGSTTMFLNGRVVNQPSDKEGERRVGDAILVTPRK